MTDLSTASSTLGTAKSGISSVTSGLKSLGVISDDTAEYLTMANSALSIVTAMLGVAKLFQAKVVAKTAEETAAAAADVAVRSWNVAGLATIAVAGVASAAASVALTKVIKADLSTASGRSQAIQGVLEACRWQTRSTSSATSSR